MKRFLFVAVLLFASTAVVVAAPSQEVSKHKGDYKANDALHYKPYILTSIDAACIDHALVEIPLCVVKAVEVNATLANGHTPKVTAKARAPTTN